MKKLSKNFYIRWIMIVVLLSQIIVGGAITYVEGSTINDERPEIRGKIDFTKETRIHELPTPFNEEAIRESLGLDDSISIKNDTEESSKEETKEKMTIESEKESEKTSEETEEKNELNDSATSGIEEGSSELEGTTSVIVNEISPAAVITGKWGTVPYEFNDTTGVLTFRGKSDGSDTLGQTSISPWNLYSHTRIPSTNIKKIVFTEKVKTPINSQFLFSSGTISQRLTKVESFVGLANLDTTQTTNMRYMFTGMSSLTSLDLGANFNTSNVTQMELMFSGLSALTSLDLGAKFNTINVTEMGYMFQGMSSLTSLDLGANFNTSKVTAMSYMFSGMSSLTSLDLGANFNTSSVKIMSDMFSGMSSLTSLDLGANFNTSGVTTMFNMFSGVNNLEKLDLSQFVFKDTEVNVESMFYMANLKELTLPDSFKVISGFNRMKTHLPAITATNGYTGNWMNSKKLPVGTTSRFMTMFGSADIPAGTYTWEVAGQLRWGDVPYEFDDKTGVLTFHGKTDGSDTLGEYTASPWNRPYHQIVATDIKKIVFTKKVKAPINSRFLFSSNVATWGLTKVASIDGVANLDTTQTTNMSHMFRDLSSLTSLDLGANFHTSNVTQMEQMFTGLSALTSLDLGANFHTSNVTNMERMFRNMSSLTSLDLGANFNTSKVTFMTDMFRELPSLTSLDLGANFHTSNVIDMSYMFTGMSSLRSLTLGAKFNTSKATNMNWMFTGVKSLEKLDLSQFTFKNTNVLEMFDGMANLKELTLPDSFKVISKKNRIGTKLPNIAAINSYTGNWMKSNNVSIGRTLAFMENFGTPAVPAGTYRWEREREQEQDLWGTVPFDFEAKTGVLTFRGKSDGSDTLGDYTTSPWNRLNAKIVATDIKKIVFTEKVKTPINSKYLFSSNVVAQRLTKVASIDGVANLDTRQTTNMYVMFTGLSSLTSLDLGANFNTSNVTEMTSMFEGMSSLRSLTLGANFNTSNVTNMNYMFHGVSSLTSLDLGANFNTSDVIDMRNMFHGMSSLTSLDLGANFNTSDVTNMTYMFLDLSSLRSLTLGANFNTSNVIDMRYMFNGLSSLTSLDLGANFNTSNVTAMNSMFSGGTSSLTSLDLGAKFNMSNVIEMSYMFNGMSSLRSLTLSAKFNTSKATNMNSMFSGVKSLEKLDLSQFTFKDTNVSVAKMFNGMANLKELTLPTSFKVISQAARTGTNLPSIAATTGYTGNWMNSKNVSVGTTEEFMTNFGSAAVPAGTYTWEVDSQLRWGDVPYEFDDKTGVLTFSGKEDGSDTLGEHTTSPWNRSDDHRIVATEIKKIVFSKKVKAPTYSGYLFSSPRNTQEGGGNFLGNVTSFTGLDFLDTSGVTSMYEMFNLMDSLTNLTLGSDFKTSSVLDMEGMFSNMHRLSSLTLGDGFKTNNVTSMYRMFYLMSSLTNLTLGDGFKTNNVTNMSNMFFGMVSLSSLTLGNDFNTSSVTDMKAMFQSVNMLNSLTLGSQFDTGNVTDMGSMFSGMTNLTSLSLGEQFDTSSVTSMVQMFAGAKLESLNLSQFIFKDDKVDVRGMFGFMENLKELTLPDSFKKISPINRVGTALSAITTNGYTGNWMNSNNVSVGTTKAFMENFGTPAVPAGTYRWEQNLWGTVPWTFEDGVLTLYGKSDGSDTLGGQMTSPWNRTTNPVPATEIKKIVFTKTVKTPVNSEFLFSSGTIAQRLTNVKSFDGFTLDTTQTDSIRSMFSGMSSLESLNLGANFNTSSVTIMSGTFIGMSSLKSLNLGANFNTSSVSVMNNMFQGMSSLESLNLGDNFNTRKVESMLQMFSGMSGIKSLNLGAEFDTIQVKNMDNMFSNVRKLEKLDLSQFTFKDNKVTVNSMFHSMANLKELTLPDSFKVISKTNRIGTNLPAITVTNGYSGNWANSKNDVSVGTTKEFMENFGELAVPAGTYRWEQNLWGTVPYAFDDKTGVLTFHGKTDGSDTLGEHTTSPWNRPDNQIVATDIKKIVFTKKVKAPINSRYLFSSEAAQILKNVQLIDGLANIDTKQVTNMERMFFGMSALTNLNLGVNFDTSKVEKMSGMFLLLSELPSLDLGANFNTSLVKDTQQMFSGMSNLTSLDLGANFDTSSVIMTSSMFRGMSSLTSLNFGEKFDTSNVINMYGMFREMSSLASLDLSTFIFKSGVVTGLMFSELTSMKELTLPETFTDPDYVTGLPSIAKTQTYTGNWIDSQDVSVGTSKEFMEGYDGSKPGKYIWEETPLELQTIPEVFNFGENNFLWSGKQSIPLEDPTIDNMHVRMRANVSDWQLAVSGSKLETSKGENLLSELQFKMKLKEEAKPNKPSFGATVKDEFVKIPMDGATSVTLLEASENKGIGEWDVEIDPASVYLNIPTWSNGDPNGEYTGKVTWTLELLF